MKAFKQLSIVTAFALAGFAQHAAAAALAASAGGDLKKGEKVFAATCQGCHGAGVLGAPKVGDKAAWAPRVAKGQAKLYASALNGFNMMPPRGGNGALSDGDVKAAVDYMVSKAK
jgi:cytochrome c5